MGISAALGSSALLPAGLGFRNKLINGAMVVAQRGTAAVTGSASAQYPVDRWVVYNGTGTVTFQQSTTAPAGYSNSLLATVTATGSYSTTGYTEFAQHIEGFNAADLAWGTASAKQIVLSFWTRASVTGAYNICFQNASQGRSYVTTFTVNASNTWEYKTIYVNGDTSGTWATDNTVGLRVWLNLGMGSAYDTTANTWTAGNYGSTSGAVDFAANSGATFYITGVQLEQNYQPTPFEQRPIGVELALCQRYYQRITASGGDNAFAAGVFLSSTQPLGVYTFPIMRAAPTLNFTNGTYDVVTNAAAPTASSVVAFNVTTSTAQLGGSCAGATAGGGCVYRQDSGYFDLASEL